jgi:hypothetical protein
MAAAEMVASYSYYGYGKYAYGPSAKKSGNRFMFWKNRKTETKKAEAAAG